MATNTLPQSDSVEDIEKLKSLLEPFAIFGQLPN